MENSGSGSDPNPHPDHCSRRQSDRIRIGSDPDRIQIRSGSDPESGSDDIVWKTPIGCAAAAGERGLEHTTQKQNKNSNSKAVHPVVQLLLQSVALVVIFLRDSQSLAPNRKRNQACNHGTKHHARLNSLHRFK